MTPMAFAISLESTEGMGKGRVVATKLNGIVNFLT